MALKAKSDWASAGFSSFYKTRQCIYGALLLFVIVVSLPIAAIPKLRDRLVTRIQVLKDAVAGKRAPVLVQVGESTEPFPAEFERLTPTVPQLPQLPPAKVHSTAQGGYIPRRGETSPPPRGGDAGVTMPSSSEEEPSAQIETESAASDNEPRYRQGKTEQDAYDLLIQSSAAIAEIVKGHNPSFKFKSWDAAGRGDDVFWVRLKLQKEGESETEYIWQVKLQSKQVGPLNYNARSIS